MEEKIIYHEIGKDPMFKIWHASKQSMFIYMNSDGGSIVCSEKAYPIKKGALCFVSAGKYHYTMPDNAEVYDRSKLFICEDELDKILKILPENTDNFLSASFAYALIDESERDKVDEIFRKLKEFEYNEFYGEWIMISCVIELLVFLNRYLHENTPAVSGAMNRAIEYINSNIIRNITIDEICSEIHMSKYYFCRQFKKATGTTVMKYILKTRLILAKNELKNTNLSISEISEKCGFSSVSYFCHAFKEQENCSALQYKKSNKS